MDTNTGKCWRTLSLPRTPLPAGQPGRAGPRPGSVAAAGVTPYVNLVSLLAPGMNSTSDTRIKARLNYRTAPWNAMAAQLLRAGNIQAAGGTHPLPAQPCCTVGYHHHSSRRHAGYLVTPALHPGRSACRHLRAYLEGAWQSELDRFRTARPATNSVAIAPRTTSRHRRFRPCRWAWAADGGFYEARYIRYLEGPRPDRGAEDQRVWRIPGERRACRTSRRRWRRRHGGRQKLDNLIFVVNCNLQLDWPGAHQRQDHPGAGKRLSWRRLQGIIKVSLGRQLGPAGAGYRQYHGTVIKVVDGRPGLPKGARRSMSPHERLSANPVLERVAPERLEIGAHPGAYESGQDARHPTPRRWRIAADTVILKPERSKGYEHRGRRRGRLQHYSEKKMTDRRLLCDRCCRCGQAPGRSAIRPEPAYEQAYRAPSAAPALYLPLKPASTARDAAGA